MEYFIIENGQQAGPFTSGQLAEKHIAQETLVWREGMTDWTPAWQVSELRALLFANPSGGVPPVPPPPGPSASPRQSEEEAPRRKKKNRHIVPKICLAVVVLFLGALAVTNPSREDHRMAVKKQVNLLIDKTGQDGLDANDIFSMGMRTIAKMISGSVVDVAFDSFFEYHNYILFSKGTVSYDGQDHNVSFGILGKVYTLNADDIVKAVQSNSAQEPAEESGNTVDESTDLSDQDVSANTLEDKADQVMGKVADRVSKKVEEKINKKLDQLTDSSTIDKIIDKLMGN